MTPTVNTIPAALLKAATTACGLRAIEYDGRSLQLPYAELLADALRIAGSLDAVGLKPGDRVALVIPDVSGFVRVFLGISVAGMVPVPLFPPAQAGDVVTFSRQSRQVLAASRAAAVVAADDIVPLLDLETLVPRPLALTVDGLMAGPSITRDILTAPDATALLQFTSGSTAAPKGVVLTHANIHANVTAIANRLELVSSDVGVSWLPLYHDMGLIGMMLTALFAGLDVVIMSPVLFLKRPTAWLEAISTYRGSVSFAPNFSYELCLRRVKSAQIDTLDLSTWRVAGCGAEPIRAETLRAFAERFARAGFRATSFVPSYGLAEHSVAVSLARGALTVDAVDAGRLVADSLAVPAEGATRAVQLVGCGRPFPGHEVLIVDEREHPLPERHVGRITARGPSMMRGYFDNPAATAETLGGGWLHTGDLGYIADGELFVCGRTKDLIIRHGRKYHPPDLESAIADLDGVRSTGIVVFGISRVEGADEVVAVLEARASVAVELTEQVRRRVLEASGLELDHVMVTPPGTIPRTTSGKVRRSETRTRFQAGTLLTGGV